LIVAPHMDDEVLGCGGLIQARRAAGWEVWVLGLCGRVYDYGRVSEEDSFREQSRAFLEAQRKLGVSGWQILNLPEGAPTKVGHLDFLEAIERVVASYQPHEVVVPSVRDLNQDHRFVADVCRIVFRPANLQSVERVLAFQSPDGDHAPPNYYVPITDQMLRLKLEAFRCYKTEVREAPHPRSEPVMEARHRVLGSRCGSEYAEGFELLFAREGGRCESRSRGGVGSSERT